MASFFKKKPTKTEEDVLEEFLHVIDELGAFADSIIDAASLPTDVEVALIGAATICAIITGAKKDFGSGFELDVKEGSVFSAYLYALEQKDLFKMAEMTRHMADILQKAGTARLKGGAIHFWFNGEN